MPPKFTPNIQWTLLKHTEKILMAYIYGTFTLYGKTFQSNFNFTNEDPNSRLITPHLHLHFYRGFSLFYTAFARRY